MKTCYFLRHYRLFFLLALFYCDTISGQEVIPKLNSVIEFGEIKIGNINNASNTVSIIYSIKSIESVDAKTTLIKGNDKKIKTAEQSTLQKEVPKEQTFDIIIHENNSEMISILIEVPDVPEGYKKTYYHYFKLIKTEDGIELFDPRYPGDKKPKEVKEKSSKGVQSLSMNYNVNISGKILITGLNKGLYGNGVVLWFRNSNKPEERYHPVLGNTQHINYDILDNEGNFKFNFSFNGDLTQYNQAIILVNTANAATYMPAPPDGYIVWENNSYTTYFNESEGVVIPINGSNSTISANQNGYVNGQDGEILRYMMLARELSMQRYGGSSPYNIAPILTKKEAPDQGAAGVFRIEYDFGQLRYVHYIQIHPSYTDFNTVSHEYGHYINFCMWGREKFSDANDDLKEGWAIFYSFATRNYANNVHGDYYDTDDDNTETGPFFTPTRYGNIRYAYHGQPYKAAVGCYIWSLYDSYEAPNFETSPYNVGDNDDVSDQSLRVFETMRNLGTTNPDGFHVSFKSGLASDLQTSIDYVHTFMYSNLTSIPSTKMKSAQIKNFNANIISSNQINFSWSSRSYSYTSSYQNREDGYKLFYKNGSSWELITTVPAGQTSYTYNSSPVNKEYKISSYNLSGESNSPSYYSPLYATMSGPTSLSNLQSGTWTVTASGGTPPYSCSWSYYVHCDEVLSLEASAESGDITPDAVPCGSWFSIYNTTNTVTKTSDGRTFDLKCVVTDANSSTYTITKTVTGSALMKQNFDESSEFETLETNPNPFNPTTKITFTIPNAGHVSLKIYDVLGREVAELADRVFAAGKYEFEFNANNLPSGIYITALVTEKSTLTKKIMLVK